MYVDPDGQNPLLPILILLGVILGTGAIAGIISTGSQWIINGWDNINCGQVLFDFAMGCVSGALITSGLGVGLMITFGATIGFASGIGTSLINEDDFGDWQTWLNIGVLTGMGAIFGWLGGAGAQNSKMLTKFLHNTTKYVKAAASYDRVLTKIALGSYKNLAGAAGARAITVSNLQRVWSETTIRAIKNSIIKGIFWNSLGNMIS